MNYLIETPRDVLQIIEQFKKQKFIKPKGKDLLVLLESMIDDARTKILEAKVSINWKLWFLRAGFIVYSILMDYGFDELHFAKFLLGKHRRYTAKPLLRWKELGVLIRLDSKVSRLICITSAESSVGFDDEPPEKTVEDILGYCILGHQLACQLNNT